MVPTLELPDEVQERMADFVTRYDPRKGEPTPPPPEPKVPPGRSRTETRKRRTEVFERDGYKCVTCGTSDHLTLDHRIPRSRGGTNELENLQTMCFPCNNRKGNKLP